MVQHQKTKNINVFFIKKKKMIMKSLNVQKIWRVVKSCMSFHILVKKMKKRKKN